MSEAKQLPDNYIKDASAFWVPMEPQPTGDKLYRYIWGCSDGVHDYKDPHAVGDTLYEREEWRVVDLEPVFGMGFYIEYRDGTKIRFHKKNSDFDRFDERDKGLQPASTMPEWASDPKKRKTVTSVEAKRCQDLSVDSLDSIGIRELVRNVFIDDNKWKEAYDLNDWGWYVTVEDES